MPRLIAIDRDPNFPVRVPHIVALLSPRDLQLEDVFYFLLSAGNKCGVHFTSHSLNEHTNRGFDHRVKKEDLTEHGFRCSIADNNGHVIAFCGKSATVTTHISSTFSAEELDSIWRSMPA